MAVHVADLDIAEGTLVTFVVLVTGCASRAPRVSPFCLALRCFALSRATHLKMCYNASLTEPPAQTDHYFPYDLVHTDCDMVDRTEFFEPS
jgi:hypothetical protein